MIRWGLIFVALACGTTAHFWRTEDDSLEVGAADLPELKNTTCQCGLMNKDLRRIINGRESSLGKYPFMVSLRNSKNQHFCGGSIITPLHVLTAAHCVSSSKNKSRPVPADLFVVAGAHNIEHDSDHGETQRLAVKQVAVPLKWFSVMNDFSNDIAVLVLKTPVRYSKWVSPVCLTPQAPDLASKYIKAMGWGLTETGKTPDNLMETNVQVMDKTECNSSNKEVCFRVGRSASCRGDSGGPYVYVDPDTERYTQVSLVSYGKSSCQGKRFIGTNVALYYKWIESAVKATSEYSICRKLD